MAAALTTDVPLAARTLRDGGLVAFATETVYGLGANALDPRAVARIFEAKQRPLFDPLIVHLAEPGELNQLCPSVPVMARQLVDAFWPGPLTLVLPKREIVPDLVTAGLPTVAVRLPDHTQARDLIRRAGVPVAAPSANLFGRISPTSAEHVLEQLGERIDVVLDGGTCRVGVESTIVWIPQDESERPLLLRPGGISVEEIEAIIGDVELIGASDTADQPRLAPGMLTHHYAPSKPLELVENWSRIEPRPDIGVLRFQSPADHEGFGACEVLSPEGSLTEAAANLFAALRRLERSNVVRVFAELAPDKGLGRAINDRLRRASSR